MLPMHVKMRLRLRVCASIYPDCACKIRSNLYPPVHNFRHDPGTADPPTNVFNSYPMSFDANRAHTSIVLNTSTPSSQDVTCADEPGPYSFTRGFFGGRDLHSQCRSYYLDDNRSRKGGLSSGG